MKKNDRDSQYSLPGEAKKEDLIKRLEGETQVLRNPRIKSAFEKVDRADFIQPDYKVEAYEDYALPIGHGQTISQPTTVAFMLELLEVNEGDEVLDVGSGSAWTTALLAEMVGREGEVLGLEIVPELVEQGRYNLSKYDYSNAHIEEAGNQLGLERGSTYDKILVSADADEIPKELVQQLKVHGVMVIPVKGAIYKVKKIDEHEVRKIRFPGFAFVPLK
jgi:protein-L-isoaspartate(D-aspartate) O-methyltransferase